jgi:hypothetical protein
LTDDEIVAEVHDRAWGGYRLPPGMKMSDVRQMDEELFEGERAAAPEPAGEPAFRVERYGSKWELRQGGWFVNDEPYNPDEDGVHQPSSG